MTDAIADEADVKGPLSGVRIIDQTSVVFGPYATQALGDLGADVIKIEGPQRGERGEGGDTMRYAGTAPASGFGPIFMNLNRNKRSVFLDLAKEEDRARLRILIGTADVFVSNVRMAALKRLKLGYEDVAALKPDIIYAHGSGYDSDGPAAALAAYDDLIQARSGMTDLTRRSTGHGADQSPRYLPSLIADKISGLFLTQAILAALYHRQKTGEGQSVEVPMLEAATSFNLIEHFFNHTFDPPTGEWGYTRVLSEHRRPYRTKDGYIAVMPYSTEQWDKIFAFMGRPGEILDNPKFASFQGRTEHINELYATLAEISPSKTTAEWLEMLEALGVPHSKLNGLDELFDDKQLKAVGMFRKYNLPNVGDFYQIKPPMKFSRTPASIRRLPPGVGEHTAEVFAEAGIEPAPAAPVAELSETKD
ncbi:MAG TPA: CoA transferase [Caulobacteraceae bacterium]|jgi:crotonobetainyl-CoA:carnitine CoA-transferase CaiB-like acyl-CoA transferase|nr:CoA transferase [Caulobacteraceae bacterium]